MLVFGRRSELIQLSDGRMNSTRRDFLRVMGLGAATAMTSAFAADKKSDSHSRPSARELINRPGTLVIAHRGLPEAFPENSVPAFQAALEYKPDFIELDYRHSSDGIPIVIHDEKLDRTTDSFSRFGLKDVLIGIKSAAQLAELDAGAWFGAQFAGTPLPTLDASLDAILAGSCCMVERKDGDAKTCVELLKRKRVEDRVIVQAFDWDYIRNVRKLNADIVTGLLGKGPLDAAKIAEAKEIGSEVVGWADKDLQLEAIAAAQAAGLKVWCWTVNQPERAQQLAAAGLNGLITNRADVARKWLGRS